MQNFIFIQKHNLKICILKIQYIKKANISKVYMKQQLFNFQILFYLNFLEKQKFFRSN
ncbi:hypothetical protein IMG5_181200 [Ichthyophthirius multifiliis]|uniref:Uncharacterized protein n=1 Tax=Ichthyophthirius multifiliis TaxID=5932 RepID=G0R2Y0_ICHMU|nr:hypothetical protein IMG5_181200 [Ichthyophthirius multifiliis]EGR28191.1 hypothetical protein IMG5_181200 [Ichthyophthirius multifiliis]|eukprot:XP_004027536.1 hypothetical protein IMG5_181200 [Ichthyophthirius multifiliis]